MAKTLPGIDAAQLLRELDAAGVSPVAVADRLGIGRSTPYRWIEGSEPLYSHGAGLLVLHGEVCPKRSGAGQTVPDVRHGETKEAQPRARTASQTSTGVDDEENR